MLAQQPKLDYDSDLLNQLSNDKRWETSDKMVLNLIGPQQHSGLLVVVVFAQFGLALDCCLTLVDCL